MVITHDNDDDNSFYNKGKSYWQNIEPNIDGMLGGFTNVNVPDVDESRGLLKKILYKQFALDKINNTDGGDKPSLRVLDCGAG